MNEFDVVIIGGGHNGLSLGCYLARAGLDVVILERRGEFGGGLSTEESTIPGFYHNLHSNFHGTMPFFPPYEDFDIESHGATYFHPEANIGMPLKDGRALVLYVDELRAREEILRFSAADAEAWMEMRGVFMTHVEEMMSLGYSPPMLDPKANEYVRDLALKWFGQDVWSMSALDFVKSRFENPHVQALMLFHAAVGGWDVRIKGLGMLSLAFLAYITNWQLCRGGSHHLAHVLGGIFVRHGGDLREHAPVRRILLGDGRATGVETT
ncbi:MAG: NAD(P)/FAD-dependent oxidoreductase, partial [Proteobacteria bacterium]|nr:NAD(P)/FAD-dependent oxidoreductase [Pseudomonadota bacterium]